MTFEQCPVGTSLTDAEIADIVRHSARPAGLARSIETFDTLPECRLVADHDGRHASWAASVRTDRHDDAVVTAWLRWDDDSRDIDWLADCVVTACVLYRGHGDECNLLTPEVA